MRQRWRRDAVVRALILVALAASGAKTSGQEVTVDVAAAVERPFSSSVAGCAPG